MGFKDPVCPLLRALYGHPDSGGYWEKHCEKHLLNVGFEPIQDWRSCFFHPGLKMFLVVYVDDFKMAGKATYMKRAWGLVRQGLRMEAPVSLGK